METGWTASHLNEYTRNIFFCPARHITINLAEKINRNIDLIGLNTTVICLNCFEWLNHYVEWTVADLLTHEMKFVFLSFIQTDRVFRALFTGCFVCSSSSFNCCCCFCYLAAHHHTFFLFTCHMVLFFLSQWRWSNLSTALILIRMEIS